MTTSKDSPAIAEALEMIQQAEAILVQARTRLQLAAGEAPSAPYMDAKLAARVEKLGPVAYRHAAAIKANGGSMTRAESLTIRRELFGPGVQATANLFGGRDSGALFYRDRKYGTAVKDTDPICLTKEGTRIAELWSSLHPS
jgi:hypothetical protein